MLKYRTKLTIMGAQGTAMCEELRTGCTVPENGFYRVIHAAAPASAKAVSKHGVVESR